MKNIAIRGAYYFLLIIICILSCKKSSDIGNDEKPQNKAPKANAGPDQTITLPTDSVVLNGTGSTDQDGIISSYRWTKIIGPTSYLILDSTSAQTTVKNLVQGTYSFQLTVTDNGGATAKDNVWVTVQPIITYGCNGNTRPTINITATQIGTLSRARIPCVAAAGNKIVFAGGPFLNGPGYEISAVVDIYDVNSKKWDVTTLSIAREGIAAVSNGNKIFFAGGGFWDLAFANIDIYDVAANTWMVTDLSIPRSYLTAAAVGNKVLFAGGWCEETGPSSRVDIYDLETGGWSTAELSQARYNLSAVTAGDKIYFAGGYTEYYNSKQVDIYDNSTNSWSTYTFQKLAGSVSGVVSGNKIYWGGIDQVQNTGPVEIWNTDDGSVIFDCLTYPRYAPTVIRKSDDIVFLASAEWNNEINFLNYLRNQVDIYNTSTGQWTVGLLPGPVVAPGVICVNNSVYMGGGRTGKQSCSDKVYVLSW